jgi:hypothetical protein
MNARPRSIPRFVPLAAALALAAVLPSVARAQAESGQPTATAPQPALKDRRLETAERKLYVGDYTLTMPDGETMPFRIWEVGESLMAQPGDDEPSRLMYQGDQVFRPEKQTAIAVTFVIEGEKAVRFTAKRDDRDGVIQGVRKP